MSATLELNLEFHVLARRPDLRQLGRRWNVHLVVDGRDHVFEEGPRHAIPIDPGSHQIEVYFTGAGVNMLAGLLGIRYGLRSLRVDVADGATRSLLYKGGLFWTFSGGELTVL